MRTTEDASANSMIFVESMMSRCAGHQAAATAAGRREAEAEGPHAGAWEMVLRPSRGRRPTTRPVATASMATAIRPAGQASPPPSEPRSRRQSRERARRGEASREHVDAARNQTEDGQNADEHEPGAVCGLIDEEGQDRPDRGHRPQRPYRLSQVLDQGQVLSPGLPPSLVAAGRAKGQFHGCGRRREHVRCHGPPPQGAWFCSPRHSLRSRMDHNPRAAQRARLWAPTAACRRGQPLLVSLQAGGGAWWSA